MTRQEAELIERYLEGKLEGQELTDFEAKRRDDVLFNDRVEEQRKLVANLGVYGRRKELKKKLNAYHAELQQERRKKERSKIVKFFHVHYPTIAVAASVAIITVFATLFSIEYLHSIEKKQHAYYKELRRDLDKIRTSQKKIIQEINADAKTVVTLSGGTGFAITSSGYLVTSYHIVKGADSVLIENKHYKNLKAVVVETDKAHDLAVLKIQDTAFSSFGNLPYVFKNTATALAEKVFILGYPKEDMVYGEGCISSESGYEGDTTSYEVSVPVNPGNSGSPLLDNNGNVVGIISGKHIEAEGESFAIKSEYIASILKFMSLDSGTTIALPKYSKLKGYNRSQQIKKLQDYVFMIKVYRKD